VTEADLIRFVDAQAQVYRQVLTAGRKTHWMWFIFPQLSGLGHSAMAQRYALQNMHQARRYLADPILGDRLRHDVRLMVRHKDKSALEILGSLDDFKFRSCLTLFSRKLWSNSTMARQILAPWNCCGPSNLVAIPPDGGPQFTHARDLVSLSRLPDSRFKGDVVWCLINDRGSAQGVGG
jgi:uncharacterized protein (DUF1810 family)